MVIHDPARKQFGFDGARRCFESLEHLDHVEQTALAADSGALANVLPLKQETYEVGLGDRLNLPAQAADGRTMNPGQDAPVAKFLLNRAGPKTTSKH